MNGGSIEILNTAGSGESMVIPLPAANWRRIPQDPNGGLRGWRYKERVKDAPTDDYRVFVLFKQNGVGMVKRLKITLKDRVGSLITYTLDEEAQGSMGVRFFSGADQHCADFGGFIKKDDSRDLGGGAFRGRFVAKDAPAPADCSLGSPSGAFLDVGSSAFE